MLKDNFVLNKNLIQPYTVQKYILGTHGSSMMLDNDSCISISAVACYVWYTFLYNMKENKTDFIFSHYPSIQGCHTWWQRIQNPFEVFLAQSSCPSTIDNSLSIV